MRSIPNVGKAERRSQNENIHGTGEYYPYLALHRPIPICSVWVVFSEFLLSYIHVFCGFFSLLSVIILVLGTVIGILSLSTPTQLLLGEHPAGGCSGWIKCTTCPYCGEREWRASCLKNHMLLARTKKFAATLNEQYIVYNGRCWPVARQNVPNRSNISLFPCGNIAIGHRPIPLSHAMYTMLSVSKRPFIINIAEIRFTLYCYIGKVKRALEN